MKTTLIVLLTAAFARAADLAPECGPSTAESEASPGLDETETPSKSLYEENADKCFGTVNCRTVWDEDMEVHVPEYIEGMEPGSEWYNTNIAPFDPDNLLYDPSLSGNATDSGLTERETQGHKTGPHWYPQRGKPTTHIGRNLQAKTIIDRVMKPCTEFHCTTADGSAPHKSIYKKKVQYNSGGSRRSGTVVAKAKGRFNEKYNHTKLSTKNHFQSIMEKIAHKTQHHRETYYSRYIGSPCNGGHYESESDGKQYIAGRYFYNMRSIQNKNGMRGMAGHLTIHIKLHDEDDDFCKFIKGAIGDIAGNLGPAGAGFWGVLAPKVC